MEGEQEPQPRKQLRSIAGRMLDLLNDMEDLGVSDFTDKVTYHNLTFEGDMILLGWSSGTLKWEIMAPPEI